MDLPGQDYQKFLIINVNSVNKEKIKKQLLIEIVNLTYDKFIRKILRNVHIPVKNQSNCIMKIEHMGLPITVQNDFDLQFIIRSILLNNENINVSLTFAQITQQTKQQIVFNEVGEKLNDEFALNEPSDPRYVKKQKKTKSTKVNRSFSTAQAQIEDDLDGEDEVICVFCKESVNNLEQIKKLGWFYGPFKHKKHQYYVHLMCAIWTPAVFLSEKTNRMMNIKKEIQRSNKILCKYCGNFGGGLGCKVADCKQSFHFKCALNEDIDTRLDHQKFELYCPAHAYIFDQKVQDEIEKVHCEKCNIDENEELILLCDNCDKALHTYCLEQRLDSVPEGDWFCPQCLEKNPRLQSHLPPQLPNFNAFAEMVQNKTEKINSNKNSQVALLSQNSSKKIIDNINSQSSSKKIIENIYSQKNNLFKQDEPKQFSQVIDQEQIQQISKNSQKSSNKVTSDQFIDIDFIDNLWDAPLSPIIKKGQSDKNYKIFDEES